MKTWNKRLPVINLSGYNPDARVDLGTSIESRFFETSASKGNLSDCMKNEIIIIEEIYIGLSEIYSEEIYDLVEKPLEEK